MNYKVITEFPNQMLFKSGETCISLYMPTHRHIFDHKKDILVFKNLIKDVESSLKQRYESKDMKELLFTFKKMEHDLDLWNHSKDGLVIFATQDEMIIYRLGQKVEPFAIVSSGFHIKPLVGYFQAIETFMLLALKADSFAIYVGNHYEIKPFELPDDTQTTLTEILGDEYTDSYQTHGTYGGASEGSTFHGHGGRSDGVEIDREKFFRHVDRFVLESLSKKIKHPLILVAHKAHHFDFKEVSNNPYLLDQSIDGSFEDFKEADIKKEIKVINDKRFDVLVQKELERFHNLEDKQLSSDQLIIVLKALLGSRVETLMIEANKIIPGKIDKEKQMIIKSELSDPETDDLLDDMLEHAYLTGTKVLVLDKEKMPSTSGVAATFRY